MSVGTVAAYLFLLSKQRDRFVYYFGLSWFAYLLSLLVTISIQYLGQAHGYMYGIRMVCDMLHLVFLLFGAYTFARVERPSYWTRICIIIGIWVTLCLVYRFNAVLVYLPLSIFELACTAVLCGVILRHWGTAVYEKAVVVACLAIWGIDRAVFPILQQTGVLMHGMYVSEILLYNMLNFSIVISYMRSSVARMTKMEKNFRVIAENAADIIFFYEFKPAPMFTYVTPSVKTMTGYTPQEFYDNPRFYLNLAAPEEHERIAAVFAGAGGGGERNGRLVFRMVLMNGETRWVEMKYSMLYEGETPLAIEGIIRDISLMKSAEDELIESKHMRQRLFSYVSHELRLPLSSIIGYTEAIQNGTISGGERDGALAVVCEKARLLNDLIDDLVQLSQLETGTFNFNYMLCNADELAAELIASHTGEVSGKNVAFIDQVKNSPSHTRAVIADKKRISQVLSNLINNAAKFSGPRDEIRIVFSADAEEGKLNISVSDKGEGIKKSDIPRIFERFFTRGGTDGRNQGRGIGLALSKEIVEAHGGTLGVSSKKAKGSTFTIGLPFYRDNDNIV
jgi:PAS domain S-box-containing protein